ncbi:hypothetical protein AMTRI_Chr01g130830 [Amborella trichopoda]
MALKARAVVLVTLAHSFIDAGREGEASITLYLSLSCQREMLPTGGGIGNVVFVATQWSYIVCLPFQCTQDKSESFVITEVFHCECEHSKGHETSLCLLTYSADESLIWKKKYPNFCFWVMSGSRCIVEAHVLEKKGLVAWLRMALQFF